MDLFEVYKLCIQVWVYTIEGAGSISLYEVDCLLLSYVAACYSFVAVLFFIIFLA